MQRLVCKIILLLMLVGIAEAQYSSAMVISNLTSQGQPQIAVDTLYRWHQLPTSVWTNVVVWQPCDEAVWDVMALRYRGSSATTNFANAVWFANAASAEPLWQTNNYGVFKFDGTTDRMSIYNTQMGLTSDMTLSIWIKWTTNPGHLQYFFAGAPQSGNHINGAAYGFRTVISGGLTYLSWLLANSTTTFGGAAFSTSGNWYTAGKWHHIAGTVAGTNMVLYVNGAQKGTGGFAGTRQLPLYYSYMLCDYLTTAKTAATVDDAIAFNRALTSNEVYSIYQRTKGTYGL